MLLVLQSCGGIKNFSSSQGYDKSSCYQQPDYLYTVDNLPKPIDEIRIDSTLSAHFSLPSLNVANAIGLLDLLTKYAVTKTAYHKEPSTALRIELLEIVQAINRKVNTASLEISSVTSEMDCEEERASQISHYLKNKADERETKLVIGSIIIGAAGAITAEILSNGSTSDAGLYVAIGTSLTEATLGVLMLIKNRKVSYYHTRNTPAEIWNGPAISKTLPPSIWYYLNYENPANNKNSLRKQLIENWTAFGQIKTSSKDGKTTEPVYFGQGGKYSAEQLQNRADMYDQIESYIALMKQDLKQLSIEFDKPLDNKELTSH